MKEGWEYKKLGEVATYINGFPFKPSDWKEIGKPIIRIQNLTNPHGGFNRCSRNDIPEKYFVVKGDVLISWSATLGVFEWESEDALLNQHIFKVVFDKQPIDKQFFIYAVENNLRVMESKTHGATMKHIIKKDFDNTLIPYPSLEKQREIADVLSKVEAIIESRESELQKLDDLIKARFVEMFGNPLKNDKGWKTVAISDACQRIFGGGTPSKSHPEYF